MKYTSKYIEEILTSPSAKRGLDYITPIYQEAQNALWIMQAMGLQTDVIIKWIQEYIEQVLPQTATWLLPYFEKEYGIPVNEELTINERRKNILLAIRTRAPMNPVKLAGILSLAINIDNINIKENTGKNTFSVEFSDVINKEQINKVIEILNKYKPAHLIYWFNSIIKIQFENKNNIFINKLIISSYFNNLELKIIYLNGKKILDGTWNLQAKTKNIELSNLIISGYINSLQKVNTTKNLTLLAKLKSNTKKILLLPQINLFINNKLQNIKTENLMISDFIKSIHKINISSLKLLMNLENKNKRISVSPQFKSKVKNKVSSSMNNLVISSSVKEKENIASSLTIDTMWNLDDTYSLEGKRRLNARKIDINL